MQCPHCLVHFHEDVTSEWVKQNEDAIWFIKWMLCAACEKLILYLEQLSRDESVVINRRMVYPKASGRSPVSDTVPQEFREDYEEAALILADSPKASAALSRRCLQHILREKAGVKGRTLDDEIQKVIDLNTLPSDLTESMTMLRELGNVAAHATKNENTGEIVPVDPGEADWCLDVIESLFEHYFVRPAQNERRQQALRKKLDSVKKSSSA